MSPPQQPVPAGFVEPPMRAAPPEAPGRPSVRFGDLFKDRQRRRLPMAIVAGLAVGISIGVVILKRTGRVGAGAHGQQLAVATTPVAGQAGRPAGPTAEAPRPTSTGAESLDRAGAGLGPQSGTPVGPSVDAGVRTAELGVEVEPDPSGADGPLRPPQDDSSGRPDDADGPDADDGDRVAEVGGAGAERSRGLAVRPSDRARDRRSEGRGDPSGDDGAAEPPHRTLRRSRDRAADGPVKTASGDEKSGREGGKKNERERTSDKSTPAAGDAPVLRDPWQSREPRGVTLTFVVSPPDAGAVIRVDGSVVSGDTHQLKVRDGQRVEVVVRARGFLSYRQQVDIQGDKTIRVRLRRPKESNRGPGEAIEL